MDSFVLGIYLLLKICYNRPMKLTSRNELSKYKILPFNLYNEAGDLVLKAGDALTVGKLLQLKAYEKIFRDSSPAEEEETIPQDAPEEGGSEPELKTAVKKIDDKDFSYDTINLSEYKTPVNKYSKIDYKEQIKLKAYLMKTIDLLNKTSIKEAFPKIANLSEIITQTVIPKFDEVSHYSELRLLGDYEICHPINVAIMSGMIAKKMDFEKDFISDIILAGVLHDIGKYKIPNAFEPASTLSNIDTEKLKTHTIIGHNILKEMNLPDRICNVALQHHEHNDGTGYPHGLSSDWISIESQIVNVCNSYDNFAFNKTGYVVKNNRDVLRLMLSIGTKNFSAEILYTFAHMFSYNDTMNFSDMASYSA